MVVSASYLAKRAFASAKKRVRRNINLSRVDDVTVLSVLRSIVDEDELAS